MSPITARKRVVHSWYSLGTHLVLIGTHLVHTWYSVVEDGFEKVVVTMKIHIAAKNYIIDGRLRRFSGLKRPWLVCVTRSQLLHVLGVPHCIPLLSDRGDDMNIMVMTMW